MGWEGRGDGAGMGAVGRRGGAVGRGGKERGTGMGVVGRGGGADLLWDAGLLRERSVEGEKRDVRLSG